MGHAGYNTGELSLGATVRNAAGAVEARVVVDVPQVMHNLTIARVATYVVGSDQWVVHNSKVQLDTIAKAEQIVYVIIETDVQSDVSNVYKYGIGSAFKGEYRAGKVVAVPRVYKNPFVRSAHYLTETFEEFLTAPLVNLLPQLNLNWWRPEGQVRNLNRHSDGKATYDWVLLAITDSQDDALLLERYYVSRHVQITGEYPVGQNKYPQVFDEYKRYLECP